jgi:hypothetical protein
MKEYHLWCQPCQKEYSESQAERREVDGIWGEGRWWFCPKCGTQLEAIPIVSPQDQFILAAVTQLLAQIENREPVPAGEIYAFLLEIGHSYDRNGREREACQVFFNASDFARQNNLAENDAKARNYQKIAHQWNITESQYQIDLAEQELMEAYIRYFLPV